MTSDAKPFDAPALIKDFLTAYVFGVIGIYALSWALAAFFQIELPGGVGVVPFVIGVQLAAQKHVNRGGGEVKGAAAWRAAFLMTLAAVALSFVLIGALIAVLGVDAVLGPDFMELVSPQIFGVMLLFVLAFYLLMARLGFPWLVRSALKVAALRK
ncbi:MAG: ABZJ_00895 family protein [Pseudomonadota bacterium]